MKRVIRIVEIVGEDSDVNAQVEHASIHGTVKIGKVEITSTTVDNPSQELLDLVKRTVPSGFRLGAPKLIKAGDILDENGVVGG